MIGLIPLIKNDYLLTVIYIAIIIISLNITKYSKDDIHVLACGFFIMIISETIFIKTGVEVFVRNSLFRIMPLWLPFLWAYGFVAIKRTLKILET
jgi:hypothetical protein